MIGKAQVVVLKMVHHRKNKIRRREKKQPVYESASASSSSTPSLPSETLTEEQRQQIHLLEERFGKLGVATKYYLILNEMRNEVMPVRYYACPVDWDEYVDVSKESIRDANVMWIKNNGHFCLPPTTNEDPKNKVGSPESVAAELEKERETETEEEEEEEEKKGHGSLKDEVYNVTKELHDTLNPGEVFRTRAEKARSERENKKREMRLKQMEQLEHEERVKDQRMKDIMELEKIMKEMPSYEDLNEAELRQKATDYYEIAESCTAKQNEDGTRQTHKEHMTDCASNPSCSVMNDVCVPDLMYNDIKSTLSSSSSSGSGDENESGISRMSMDREHLKAVEDLSQWWKKFYAKSLNTDELNEEQKTLVARSLLSGRE